MRPHSIVDAPNHFSDPPYQVIKPAYRAHLPMPNFNQIRMKKNYSFKPFGDPESPRKHQDVKKSPYRQTFQNDSVYYKKDVYETVDAAHAMNDASHTFHPSIDVKKFNPKNKNFMVYDFKP